MSGIGFLDWIAIGVFGVVAAELILFGSIFFLKYYQKEERNKNQLAFGIMFVLLGIGRIILIVFDYFLTGLDQDLYETHQFTWKLATFFLLVGLGTLILVSEHAVWGGKDFYLFSIVFGILTAISMIIWDFKTSQAFGTMAVVCAIFIPISYIYLAIKLPPMRKNIALIFIGFVIYGVALILMSVFLVDPASISIIYLVSACLQVPGIFIFGVGIKRMYFGS